jgi:hypothetical protein
MAPPTPVQALALPDIPKKLQQQMAVNRRNLESAGMWEFLLWVRDVDKVVLEGNVTSFVETYLLKNLTARVGFRTVDFSARRLAEAFGLPEGGPDPGNLPDLKKPEAEQIFYYNFRWGQETKWTCGNAMHHWKTWFAFVNTYLLFRPGESTMEHNFVVAAIRTWEGIEVDWAKVVQKQINEEICIRKALNPSVICLYSVFYISCLCDPTSRKAAVSPPDSSGSPTAEEMELRQANKKIADLEKQLMEKHVKIEQVQEKNAEYLQQVNKCLQEKFTDHRRIEELQTQNVALNRRIAELQESCARVQIDQEVRITRVVAAIRSSYAEDISTGPSTTEVLNPPVVESNMILSAGVCKQLWEVESKISLGLNLHQLYEIQRDLLLVMVGIDMGAVLTPEQFQCVWEFCGRFRVENLLVEILARKHLRLEDPFAAFVVLGDIGGRIYLYYAGCEEKLHFRRALGRQVAARNVDWLDYGTQMSQEFCRQSLQSLHRWRASLESVLPLLLNEDHLTVVLRGSLRRVYNSEVPDDFTASHYLYNREKAIHRVERYLNAIDINKAPPLAAQAQVEFPVAPPGYCPRYLKTVDIEVEGSMAARRYSGHYSELFDGEGEQPVPTWSAIAWILEDYGLSRTETTPADLVYKRFSGAWIFEPPPAVQVHPRFCPCARRHKWAPTATIASVEYNWPQIQGAPGFNTPAQCSEAYQRFFKEHRTHHDPMCYRAAIFCAALADWCQRWNVTINVNRHHESRHEFWLLLKLQYRPSRWIRLVEAMAITHFIEGVHISLINEFPFTRAGPLERFLKWQRRNNPKAVADDEDLQRAVLRLEAKEARQHIGSRNQGNQEDEGEGTSGSAKRIRVGRGSNN